MSPGYIPKSQDATQCALVRLWIHDGHGSVNSTVVATGPQKLEDLLIRFVEGAPGTYSTVQYEEQLKSRSYQLT